MSQIYSGVIFLTRKRLEGHVHWRGILCKHCKMSKINKDIVISTTAHRRTKIQNIKWGVKKPTHSDMVCHGNVTLNFPGEQCCLGPVTRLASLRYLMKQEEALGSRCDATLAEWTAWVTSQCHCATSHPCWWIAFCPPKFKMMPMTLFQWKQRTITKSMSTETDTDPSRKNCIRR